MIAPMPTTASDRRTTARMALRPRCRSAMPQARWKDLELVAVLRDRAPGQRDSLRRQRVGDLLVRVRVLCVLGLDHPLDLVLDAEGGREEVAEWHHLAGREHHVLLGGGAADRRLVHADQLADLCPRQWDEVLHSVEQVLVLPLYEAL